MQVCSSPGCPILVKRGTPRCPAHEGERRRLQDSARREAAPYRSLYGTSRWKRMSREKRAEKPWCEWCLERGVRTLATCVDHVKPASTHPQLFFEPSNHKSSCATCNEGRGNREG